MIESFQKNFPDNKTILLATSLVANGLVGLSELAGLYYFGDDMNFYFGFLSSFASVLSTAAAGYGLYYAYQQSKSSFWHINSIVDPGLNKNQSIISISDALEVSNG